MQNYQLGRKFTGISSIDTENTATPTTPHAQKMIASSVMQ